MNKTNYKQNKKFKLSRKDRDRLQAEAEALNLTLSTYIIIQQTNQLAMEEVQTFKLR
jgi:hypothetical protein